MSNSFIRLQKLKARNTANLSGGGDHQHSQVEHCCAINWVSIYTSKIFWPLGRLHQPVAHTMWQVLHRSSTTDSSPVLLELCDASIYPCLGGVSLNDSAFYFLYLNAQCGDNASTEKSKAKLYRVSCHSLSDIFNLYPKHIIIEFNVQYNKSVQADSHKYPLIISWQFMHSWQCLWCVQV